MWPRWGGVEARSNSARRKAIPVAPSVEPKKAMRRVIIVPPIEFNFV